MSKEKSEKNWASRHKVLTALGVIVVLIILVSAFGGGKNSTPTASNSTTNTTATQTNEKTEYKVGETADIDKRQITISNVQRNYDTGNQFAQPESGKEFVVVDVTIANNSDQSLSYGTYDFKMQDSAGVQQNESILAISQGKLNSGSLAPGGKVTGKLAYEVPSGDKGLKLLFTNPSLFNNKTLTFVLQ